jgi:hypothetical protein
MPSRYDNDDDEEDGEALLPFHPKEEMGGTRILSHFLLQEEALKNKVSSL